MNKSNTPQTTAFGKVADKSSKDSPDFVLTKYFTSLDPDWLNEDGTDFNDIKREKFSELKRDFNISDDYPLEQELIEVFIRYIHERGSTSEEAKKKIAKSFSRSLKSTDKLIKELRNLSSVEEMYLYDNLHASNTSFREAQRHLRDLRRALKTTISDLSKNKKVGREYDYATLILASNLRSIFIKSTGEEPKIYNCEYNPSGYAGNLYEFVKKVCAIFKTQTKSNLYTKLLTDHKSRKDNLPKG